MIHFIGVTNDNHVKTETSLKDIDFSSYQWFWADFNQPTEEEERQLADTFRFHPLAIEDCVQRFQRPKLDHYDDYTFFVTHIVRAEGNEMWKEELNYFIGGNFLVTFHFSQCDEVDEVWNTMLSQENKEQWDPFYVFHQILDKTVDNYFPIIYKIEDQLEQIEGNTHRRSMGFLMNELFETRYMLLKLIHTINPMRDLLYRMLHSQHLGGVAGRIEYFSDIHDHLLKLSDMIMSDRELTADIRDNYLSLNSHQTNNVMKVLTIITSIFAPLTFIAGIYGMNFENMPELTWEYSYFLILGVMAVMGLSMFIWFTKKGWFK